MESPWAVGINMKTSFIIMQIGNPELDIICEKAIVSALKKCGLDPKRVDKHNQGGLLKSEIVNFIELRNVVLKITGYIQINEVFILNMIRFFEKSRTFFEEILTMIHPNVSLRFSNPQNQVISIFTNI